MLSRLIKPIIILLVFSCVLIIAALAPEIIGSDVKEMLEGYFGEDYKKYFIACLIVIIPFAVFITSPDLWKKLALGSKSSPTPFKIPPTETNRLLVRNARTAIGKATPEVALRELNEIDNPKLANELSLLSAQWVNYSMSRPQATPKDTEYANINKSILHLITALEKELGQSVDLDKKLRDHLKERYKKRLDQKMAGRQPVNIRRLSTTVGTSSDTAKTFITNIEIEIEEEMSKVFREAKGRMLIVGAPGSGKTTVLLRWIVELLDTEKDFLPVLVNLATWRSGFIDFNAWLLEILPAEMSINKTFAKELLAQDRLLLLCDGLDEVKKDDRESLLAAIGKYGAKRERRYVISSRIEEYKEVAKDAPVYLEIEVCPLTIEQLEAELKNEIYDPEGGHLLVAMQKDEHLRHAIQTPFYFNAMQLLFANGIRLKDLQFKARSKKGREEEIKRQFIAFALNQREAESKKCSRWLSFLASRLNRRNLVSFELTDFQYNWWNWSKGELKTGNFIQGLVGVQAIGLVGGLAVGLLVGLFGGLVGDLIFGLVSGLVIGLVVSPVVGLLGGLSSIFVKGPKKGLVVGLVVGLHVGLVVGLVIGLHVGLLGGLVFGLVFGLAFGVTYGNPYDYPLIRTRDNFNFSWKSYLFHIKNNLVGGLLVGLLLGLLVGLLEGPVGGLLGGLLGGLVIGLGKSLTDSMENEISNFIQINHPSQRFRGSARALYFSILQHWHLFHLFSKYNLLPRKIVPFLDEMTERFILETDGASWRFRHRILQDYFAEQWDKDNPPQEAEE